MIKNTYFLEEAKEIQKQLWDTMKKDFQILSNSLSLHYFYFK